MSTIKKHADNELKEDLSEDEYQNDAFNEEVENPEIIGAIQNLVEQKKAKIKKLRINT